MRTIIKEIHGEGFLTKHLGNQEEEIIYRDSVYHSLELGKKLGLHYTHIKADPHIITCHACGIKLLQITHPSHVWQHTINVTDGKCNHCGSYVPIVNN